MTSRSMSNQGSVPNQPTTDAQKEVVEKTSYSGGSAMLDGHIEAEKQLDNNAVEQPIATDVAENTDTEDPIRAQNITTTGAYPADRTQLDDEGLTSIAKDSPSEQ